MTNIFKKDSADYKKFLEDGKNAIDLIEESATNRNITIAQIITRFQTLSDVFNSSNLKSVVSWNATNNGRNKTFLSSIPAYDNGNYTSFAFANNKPTDGLVLPLYLSFNDIGCFDAKEKVSNYNSLKSLLSSYFNLEVHENVFLDRKSYKVKINTPMFRKSNEKIDVYFSETAVKPNGDCIILSEADKIAKITDAVCQRYASKYFASANLVGSDTEGIVLASGFYADLRILSAMDFGNLNIKRTLYDAIALQFSNALASLSNDDLPIIRKIGCEVSNNLANLLEIDNKSIKSKLNELIIPVIESANNDKPQDKYTTLKTINNANKIMPKSFSKNKIVLKVDDYITKTLAKIIYTLDNKTNKVNMTQKKQKNLNRSKHFYNYLSAKYNTYTRLSPVKLAAIEQGVSPEKVATMSLMKFRTNVINQFCKKGIVKTGDKDTYSSRFSCIAANNNQKTMYAYVKSILKDLYVSTKNILKEENKAVNIDNVDQIIDSANGFKL